MALPKQAGINGSAHIKKNHHGAYSTEQLALIFNPGMYLKWTGKHAARFWVPIMALFTGARREELFQLHLEDIKRDGNGIDYFSFNDFGNKSIKTKAGFTDVPIHPFLVGLGIIDRVKALKKNKHTVQFPELKPVATGQVGNTITTAFTRHRRSLGIDDAKDGRKYDFHSFRSTFISLCNELRINLPTYQAVVGHQSSKEMGETSTYVNISMKMRKEVVIDRIDFHETVPVLKELKKIAVEKYIALP